MYTTCSRQKNPNRNRYAKWLCVMYYNVFLSNDDLSPCQSYRPIQSLYLIISIISSIASVIHEFLYGLTIIFCYKYHPYSALKQIFIFFTHTLSVFFEYFRVYNLVLGRTTFNQFLKGPLRDSEVSSVVE